MMKKRWSTSFRMIIVGFAGVILLGTLLLMLPVSSAADTFSPFHEALFTATSAVCVTGLVLKDTAVNWSFFGQLVIMLLIQTGGLGVITIASVFALVSGKKITLMQRSVMQEAWSAPKVGGIVRLTRSVLLVTIIMEVAGACAMMPVFIRDYGARGVWMAVFHAVSAFCNAGFDLMGRPGAGFMSLTAYQGEPVINLTICVLIIVGGLGFLTWRDIYQHRLHLKRYGMQSKVILMMTCFLIALPALFFYYTDFTGLPFKERMLSALFQSVTPRTAGFNTADLSQMTGVSRVMITVLMLIGGSPGSTAGGLKTTTFAVLLANAWAGFMRQEDARLFQRRIDPRTVCNASTILLLYIFLFTGGGMAISYIENLPVGLCLFETASAVGTVGLTLGITPGLGIVSQLILILLMFLGRVGGLTLFYATIAGYDKNLSRLPVGKIMIG